MALKFITDKPVANGWWAEEDETASAWHKWMAKASAQAVPSPRWAIKYWGVALAIIHLGVSKTQWRRLWWASMLGIWGQKMSSSGGCPQRPYATIVYNQWAGSRLLPESRPKQDLSILVLSLAHSRRGRHRQASPRPRSSFRPGKELWR